MEIRNSDRFDIIPVVMFSTSSHAKYIDETFKQGANRYISKADFFDNDIDILNKLFTPNWQSTLLHIKKEEYVLKAG